MAQSTKEINRRRHSISNTQKVTKAMEMVSAVKMRKSQMTAIAARPYAYHCITMLERLAHLYKEDEEPVREVMKKNIFFKQRKTNTTLLVLIAPDKGLVGGLNTALFSHAQKEIKKIQQEKKKIQAIAIGVKAEQFLQNAEIPIRKTFSSIANYETPQHIAPITQEIIEHYKYEVIKEVAVVYTEFFSTLKQKPSTRYILPITMSQIEGVVESARPVEGRFSGEKTEPIKELESPEYLFDPDVETLLREIAPFLVSVLTYHIVLDANASEHSARMLAMRNASTNAEQILEELTLSYNKARQNSITQEIAEVSVQAA